MKKSTCAMLIIVFILGVAGCSSKPTNMNESTYAVGIQAVEILDDYLDGKASARDAYESMDELYYRLDELKPTASESVSDIAESTSHIVMAQDILSASIDLSRIAYETKSGKKDRSITAEDILEDRNKLADRLNYRKR